MCMCHVIIQMHPAILLSNACLGNVYVMHVVKILFTLCEYPLHVEQCGWDSIGPTLWWYEKSCWINLSRESPSMDTQKFPDGIAKKIQIEEAWWHCAARISLEWFILELVGIENLDIFAARLRNDLFKDSLSTSFGNLEIPGHLLLQKKRGL